MKFKKEIREEISKIKSSINFKGLNDKISIKNLKKFNFKNKNIAGYYPLENEFNILKILEYYKNDNKILLSVVNKKFTPMLFREWNFDKNSLVINPLFKRNILLEPNTYFNKFKPDIVFIPAVAVDIYGNRIGYGGGYYDRTLKNLNCVKIATVFEFQIFYEEIENNINDIKMDYILTENVIHKIKE
jgi:5-formyltetrahydrofolate cyclo-ligase